MKVLFGTGSVPHWLRLISMQATASSDDDTISIMNSLSRESRGLSPEQIGIRSRVIEIKPLLTLPCKAVLFILGYA